MTLSRHASRPPLSRASSASRRRLDLVGPKLLACAVVLMSVLAASSARAQFAVSAIEFYDPDPNPDRALTDQDKKQGYFSRSSCECGKSIRLRLRITMDRQSPDRFIVVAGSGTCLNTTDGSILIDTCRVLKEGRIDEQDQDIEITTKDDNVTVQSLMGQDCTIDQELNIYVFTGQAGSWNQIATTTFTADGTAPAEPTADGDPVAGENLVRVAFKAGSTSQSDVRYQILCEVADTYEPGLGSAPEPGFGICSSPITPTNDAGADGSGELLDSGADATTIDGATGDAATHDASQPQDAGPQDSGHDATATAPGTITSLDPRFVCSDILQADGTTDIHGLENQRNYRFYVVAFDLHGNPSGAVLLGEGKPILAEDLWERYKRSGGAAEGGYCALDTRNLGGGPWIGMGLLFALALSHLVYRRRRRHHERHDETDRRGGQR